MLCRTVVDFCEADSQNGGLEVGGGGRRVEGGLEVGKSIKGSPVSFLGQGLGESGHTFKGFRIVNEAEVFWNSLAFSMIQQILAI